VIVAYLVITIIIAALLFLASMIQLLYLESLRLRTRDLPAIEYFKDKLEEAIGMETETGALTFTLLKHTLLLMSGIVMLMLVATGQSIRWQFLIEGAAGAWLVMLLAAYLAPQLVYRRTKGEWLRGFIPLLKAIAMPMRPFVAALAFLQSLASTNGEEHGTEETPATAAENIETLIDAGAEEGLIEEDDRRLIQSVVEFGDKTVREVMTPRPSIVAIPASASLEKLRQLVINEQYSRIPVYESSIDEIVGFVHVRDMFELDEQDRAHKTVLDILRPIRLVPETKPVQDLLREMQHDSTHMVIVVDEYGNTAGLASMEDLVEVIVGEIRDEHEPGSDITPAGDDSYIVSGSFDVGRLHDLFDFRPLGETESTTVGGLITEWLGRVPAPYESIERDGIRIEVLASNGLRVEQVKISRKTPRVESAPHVTNNE
jgi:magnesium and cobalt exporter, CNNM family